MDKINIIMDSISIGDEYSDNSKKYKSIIITYKTSNSLQFKDSKGYFSWIYILDFIKDDRFVNINK